MQQTSLSIPTEKISLSNEFVSAYGLEEKKPSGLAIPAYKTSLSDTANSFYKNTFSWEYFSNELEFE